jgi:hypothetical protein
VGLCAERIQVARKIHGFKPRAAFDVEGVNCPVDARTDQSQQRIPWLCRPPVEAALFAEIARLAKATQCAEATPNVEVARLAEVAPLAEPAPNTELARSIEVAPNVETAFTGEAATPTKTAPIAKVARLSETAILTETA